MPVLTLSEGLAIISSNVQSIQRAVKFNHSDPAVMKEFFKNITRVSIECAERCESMEDPQSGSPGP